MLWVLLTNPRAVLDAWFEHPQVKAALGYYGAHTQTAPSRVGAGYAPLSWSDPTRVAYRVHAVAPGS